MSENKNVNENEIPVGELRQQLEYARITAGDLFNIFAVKGCENGIKCCQFPIAETKLSMLLDFLFQAKLWCDVIEGKNSFSEINEEKEDDE
ncbi:MAG: hypothetical protein IJE74_03050 [Clostridia bacterium]|nr:hypothetical protein [Clostridia bacterium]